ncbi:MAG: hypothetical protein RMN51_11025 [Verrucomicrobiota bacterium]|nr:hypothetical protein [Limisphaera sp.]MDW8382620.1 hypothetical protein [Verrucomicrobiota bacterium]
MILLGRDYLLFELSGGERIPYSAESIVSELARGGLEGWRSDVLEETVKAVFHYFRHELDRETVTFEEFSRTLELALRSLEGRSPGALAKGWQLPCDLITLAEMSSGLELLFFGELRRAVQVQLRQTPGRVRFRGLRPCVKRLSGARRWCPRCDRLRERILDYLVACVRDRAAGRSLIIVD